MPLRALFLDAAGTLIAPRESVAAVYARAAAAEGLQLPEDAIRSAFRHVFENLPDPDWAAHPADGDAAERAWWARIVARTLAAAAGAPLDEALTGRCFHALFAHYADAAAWTVFPEVPALLAAARARGWKLAVVSNFDRRLHAILAGHGLAFDAVITSADARSRKPHPAIFRHALDLLAVRPEETLHAGDSPAADISGASALGLRTYLVHRPANDLSGLLEIAGAE